MQATISTTWVAWCIGFLIAPASAKALLDPIAAGTPPIVPLLVHVGSAAAVVGWVAAACGAVILVARGLAAAAIGQPRRILGPLLNPLALGVVSAGGLVALTAVAHAAAPWIAWSVFALWAAESVAFVVALGAAPVVSLRRAALAAPALRTVTALAPVVAAALVIGVAADVAATLLAGNAAIFGSAAPVAAALAIAAAASAVAAVSSFRGAAALTR